VWLKLLLNAGINLQQLLSIHSQNSARSGMMSGGAIMEHAWLVNCTFSLPASLSNVRIVDFMLPPVQQCVKKLCLQFGVVSSTRSLTIALRIC
jgi:hypothetical protein